MGLKLVDGEIVDTDSPRSHVKFYEHAKKIGIGKFVPVDFVHIQPVGQRDSMSRPATEQDKLDYPKEWAAYQQGLERQDASTTGLDALPAFKTFFGLELAAMNIHTVEELAAQDSCPVEGMEKLYSQAVKYMILSEDDDEQRETA